MQHVTQKKPGGVWFAALTVPLDVRSIIGTARFVRSTKTHDRREAVSRGAVLVAGWRAEIAKARGTLPNPSVSLWENLRREFVQARAAEGDDEGQQATAVMHAIKAQSEKVGDPQEASFRYRVAIGAAEAPIPLAPLVAAWKASLRLAQKTIDQQGRDVQRMAGHFENLQTLTPRKVKAWTDKLLTDGNTASSFERIGNGCRSFWAYLQQAGERDMLDPDPFVGAFKLAQRVAVSNKRNRKDFTAEELAKVYAEALAKGDRTLADLIALGAYTGARIEELCTLTKETAKGGIFIIDRSKTEAGIRQCPIHPAVSTLVDRMLKASTDGYLVPSTAVNQYGNRSGPLSQRFGHLKTSMGFGKSHVFHSTRRTLVTLMEQAGVAEGIAADVAGHDKKTMTYGLYSGGSAIAQKMEAISRVRYPAPLDKP